MDPREEDNDQGRKREIGTQTLDDQAIIKEWTISPDEEGTDGADETAQAQPKEGGGKDPSQGGLPKKWV